MHGFPLPLLPAADNAIIKDEESAWTLATIPDDIVSLLLAQLTPVAVAMSSQTCKMMHSNLKICSAMNRNKAAAKLLRAANEQTQGKLCEARHLRIRGRCGWGDRAEKLEARELSLLVPMARRGQGLEAELDTSHLTNRPLACQSFELMLRDSGTGGLFVWPPRLSWTTTDQVIVADGNDRLASPPDARHPGDGFADSLGAVISRCVLANVRTLRLCSNGIGDAGAVSLARGFATRGALPDLRTLELDNNAIGSIGMAALAEGFKSDNAARLETLALYCNRGIGDAGLVALSEALKEGALPMLEHLNMRQCGFGCIGMASFAKALASGAVHESCEANAAAAAAAAAVHAAGSQGVGGGKGRRRSSIGARLAAFTSAASPCAQCGRALKHRALARCTHLRCSENDVGNEGLLALASALHAGAMPSLHELSVGRLAQDLPDKHKLIVACHHGKRNIGINGRFSHGCSSL